MNISLIVVHQTTVVSPFEFFTTWCPELCFELLDESIWISSALESPIAGKHDVLLPWSHIGQPRTKHQCFLKLQFPVSLFPDIHSKLSSCGLTPTRIISFAGG